MDSSYVSDLLHHFVGLNSPDEHAHNWETLKKVLGGGRVSHKPHTSVHGTTTVEVNFGEGLRDGGLVVQTVTCFADIPKDALSIHVRKYGHFGVSFRRALLIEKGARPVVYVPVMSNDFTHSVHSGRQLLADIEAIFRGFEAYCDERLGDNEKHTRSLGRIPQGEAAVLHATRTLIEKHLLAFVKPFNAELASEHPENYYMEREWRMFGNMVFRADEVERVWVAAGYHQQVCAAFPQLAGKVCEIPAA